MEQRGPQQQRRRPVNVAEIMAQIRRRIEQKKRDLNIGGELEDLAAMKLKPQPDPHQVRALKLPQLYERDGKPMADGLVARPPAPGVALVDPFRYPALEFEKPNISVEALFYSSRGGFGRVLMIIRRFTRPLLKLFVNVDAFVFEQANVNQTLRNQTVAIHDRHQQQLIDLRDREDQILRKLDDGYDRHTERLDTLGAMMERTVHYVKLLQGLQTNLVTELTKLAIENQALKSRLAEMDDRVGLQGRRGAIIEEQVQRIEDEVAGPATGGDAPDPTAPKP